LLAGRLARLARDGGCTLVVDLGAGRGELLTALAAVDADLGLHGVDVVPRPTHLLPRIGWSLGAGSLAGLLRSRSVPRAPVLVVAWELLDVVPCPVLEVDDDGALRLVTVDVRTGVEDLGGPATPAQVDWCRRWWPPEDAEPGDRIEVGATRDVVWATAVSAVAANGPGILVAVDYAHLRGDRPAAGSLSGFRAGRAVPPVPDRTCDLTAHVAIDSVAAAGVATGAGTSLLTTQREALAELAGRATDRPGPALRERLQHAGQLAELTDPGGLGGFRWLVQTVDVESGADTAERADRMGWGGHRRVTAPPG
jgi:SAM-dependent MidA family methyltransferase